MGLELMDKTGFILLLENHFKQGHSEVAYSMDYLSFAINLFFSLSS